jgi:4-hydroxybenzoate polyprenyltransferase
VTAPSRGRLYLGLGRVSNLPTVWTNVLAGIVLAGARPTAGAVLPLAAAGSLFYLGGMFLNDAFDRGIDARERPERPIPAGLIGASEVFAVGFGLLGAGWLLVAALAGPDSPASMAALALGGAIVLYDVWHKQNPLSPVLMGLCRVLVYVTVALAVAPPLRAPVLWGSAALLAYLSGLTYVAKQENLADVRNLWPLGFLALPFVYGLPALDVGVVGTLAWLTLAAAVGRALQLLRGQTPRRIPRAVVTLIAGISLVDALLIARAGVPGGALLAMAAFPLTLGLQRYVSGT